MIVVTAAGGHTGAAVVRALWSRGERVRALVGSSQPRPELTALSAEVVATDLTDAAAVEPLLTGADALYLIWPNFDPEETAGAVALLDAARRAGVPRVVYHSVLRPQARSMPHHAAKDRVEEALDASGLAWRVLQPCAYADNLHGQFADVAADRRPPQPVGADAGAVAGRPARRCRRRGGPAHRGRAGRRHLRGGRARAADRAPDRRPARRVAGPGRARRRRRPRRAGAAASTRPGAAG